MKRWECIVPALVIILCGGGELSASGSSDYIAKVISQLDSYISWSKDRQFEGNGDYLVISAVGKSDLTESLENLQSQKTSAGNVIKVRVVDPALIPSNSHVLVFSTDDEEFIKTTIGRLRGSGTLTISQGPGAAQLGATLNFAEERTDGVAKVVVEINIDTAKAEGLTVKPSFLKIARVVKD